MKLIALKSSVERKRLMLQELERNRERFEVVLKAGVKSHFIDQQENFAVEPVLSFGKEIVVQESQELEEGEGEEYPERLELKYRGIKRKEKETRKEEVMTQQYIKGEKGVDQ